MEGRKCGLLLLLCLSMMCMVGCKSQKQNDDTVVTGSSELVSITALTDAQMQTYNAESIPLPAGITNLQIVQQRGSVVYLHGASINQNSGYEQNSTIYSISLEGDLLWSYDIKIEKEPDIVNSIRDFYPDEDGLWVMIVSNKNDESKDYPYVETTLVHLSETGGVCVDKEVEIRSLTSEPSKIMVDETRSCFYLFDLQGLSVFSIEGKELFCLSCSSYFYHPCLTSDGRLAVCEPQDDQVFLKVLDFENQIWSAVYEIKDSYGKMYRGGGDYGLYYTDSEHKKLYGLNLTEGVASPLLQWLDVGVGFFMTEVFFIDDECFLAVEERGLTLVRENSSDGDSVGISQSDGQKILTLATFEYADSAMMALQFNKSQNEYTMVVKDYSEYNTGEDNIAGLNQLNLDIASGDIPDLYDLRSIPISQYIRLGLLEDLYPYIDADPVINREDYVQSLLAAMETNGGLYCLVPRVGVMTMAADPSIVQKNESLTFGNLIDLADIGDPFGGVLCRDEFIQYMLAGNNSPFVDWESGSCDFNSDEFIQVLEFVKRLPESFDMIEMGGDDPVLFVGTGSDVSSLIFASASVGCLNEKQDCAVFVGIPGKTGMSYLLTPTLFSWGMSSQSSNKDGAWKFIRQFLLEEYQTTNSMPLLKSAWDSMRQDYDSWIENGGSFYSISLSGREIDVNITSDIYFDTAEELAIKANGLYEENPALLQIIMDEATAFFAGDKTAEQTAANIQSRVSIYMAEQG